MTDVTSCSSSMVTHLFSVMMWDMHCTADDVGCWQTAWTDSPLDSFMHSVETFHPSKHSSVTWAASSHLAANWWHAFPSQEAHVSSLSVVVTVHCPWQHITDWHNCPERASRHSATSTEVTFGLPSALGAAWLSVHHLLLPSVGWMFNYSCPITCAVFEWLGICLHTLQ
jgi:hypothetical protein